MDHPTRIAWLKFWPTSGNTLNWDAVATAIVHEQPEWLLVEAKAWLGEEKSKCRAAERGGLPKIRSAFDTINAISEYPMTVTGPSHIFSFVTELLRSPSCTCEMCRRGHSGFPDGRFAGQPSGWLIVDKVCRMPSAALHLS